MLEILDPVLKMAVLGYLVRRIDGGDFTEFIEAGFSADQLEALRRRPVVELSHIVDLGLPLGIDIKPSDVLRVGAQYDASVRELQLLDYFLSNGVHPDLAATLFRRSGAEMRRRAALVQRSVTKMRQRRRPDEAQCDAIRSAWQRIGMRETSTVERLYALHGEFPALSIDMMCQTLDTLFGTFHARPRGATALMSHE